MHITNKYFDLIVSLKNKKFREEHALFVAEGEHLADEISKSEIYKNNIDSVIVRNDFENYQLLENLKDKTIYVLDTQRFLKISNTVNPQGILTVVRKPDFTETIFENIIVGLDGINDPGNLGTIMRTCYWFGFKNIIASKETCEFYNPKTIRSSQGALFHLAFKEKTDLLSEIDKSYKLGYKIIAADIAGEDMEKYTPVKDEKYFIIFGNEANGISDEILRLPYIFKLKISSKSSCESLNVAVSSGIILHYFAQ